jgi:arylsulfatase A-like enzyme
MQQPPSSKQKQVRTTKQLLLHCIASQFSIYLPLSIRAASETPFLLYFAFQHTHQPQFAGKDFTNTTLRGPFGDALAELDWGVGQVMQALKDAGVDNDTFVFFTADNG